MSTRRQHNRPSPLAPQVVRPDGNWHKLREVAVLFGRTQRTLVNWCRDGTFSDFGYETYCQSGPGRYRLIWYVNVPTNH